jgi:hypothetical protein
MNPSIDPTERSILRDTMTSTMPVAMIAIEALWTDRFHRFRAVRNDPPVATLKPIQMIASAARRPTSLVSMSAVRASALPLCGSCRRRSPTLRAEGVAASDISTPIGARSLRKH